MTNVKRLLPPILAMGVTSTSIPTFAAIEEIVVTARKTEESLQSTPVAVTALNEEMLLNAQVTEIADLKRTAPNLSILPGGTGSSALIFIAIRGAAQVSPGGGADPSVGTYIDGVYYARPTGGNVNMFDVAQAEILRGPQGTLFGRNTTGGALNIKTNDPTGEFEGYVKAGAGNHGSVQYEGVFNLPIQGEELAARISYRSNEHDGYGDYRGYQDPNGFFFAGLPQEAAAVDKDEFARAKLRWAPADQNFVAVLSADWSEFYDTGQRTEVKAVNSTDFATFWLPFIGFDTQNFIQQQRYGDAYWNTDSSTANPDVYNDARMNNPKSTNRNTGVYLDLDFDLGDYQLKSLTAYRETNSVGTVDLDGLPVNVLTFSSRWDQEQISQEFQLNGSWGDKLNWITGLYYFDENSLDFAVSRFAGDVALIDLGAGDQIGVPLELVQNPFIPAPPPFNQIHGASTNDANFNSTSFGAYVQANYEFTDRLRGTLGVRYTKDTRKVVISGESLETGQIGAVPPGNCKDPPEARDNPDVCARTEKADFEYPAWVLSLDYRMTDNLFLYAKTSGASMAGGWNFRNTGAPSFQPENVRDIELGFKSDMLDGNLRFNGAFFYARSDDMQRTVNTFDAANNTTTQYIINAGKADFYGAELELTLVPWDGMTIDANLALLESEYKEFDDIGVIADPDNPGQTINVTIDRSNENLPQAPEMTWSIGATQMIETGLGELSLHADYSWVDKTWFEDFTVNKQADPATQASQAEQKKWYDLPSYGLLNAVAKLRTDDGKWEFSVWGRNLADEEYYTGVANFWVGVGTVNHYYGNPRTYGASVQYSW